MAGHKNSKVRKERRRETAKARQDRYDKTPIEQKLQTAGKKERAKLMAKGAA